MGVETGFLGKLVGFVEIFDGMLLINCHVALFAISTHTHAQEVLQLGDFDWELFVQRLEEFLCQSRAFRDRHSKVVHMDSNELELLVGVAEEETRVKCALGEVEGKDPLQMLVPLPSTLLQARQTSFQPEYNS